MRLRLPGNGGRVSSCMQKAAQTKTGKGSHSSAAVTLISSGRGLCTQSWRRRSFIAESVSGLGSGLIKAAPLKESTRRTLGAVTANARECAKKDKGKQLPADRKLKNQERRKNIGIVGETEMRFSRSDARLVATDKKKKSVLARSKKTKTLQSTSKVRSQWRKACSMSAHGG